MLERRDQRRLRSSQHVERKQRIFAADEQAGSAAILHWAREDGVLHETRGVLQTRIRMRDDDFRPPC